jgi:glucosamine-6-phosphate deaminase
VCGQRGGRRRGRGVDLQILGIGSDGHVGFTEPGSSLASRTRIKTLTRQTRVDNARFFGGDVDAVPTHCLTQGIGTIMDARHLVLLASGAGKSEAATTSSRERSRPCGRAPRSSCTLT